MAKPDIRALTGLRGTASGIVVIYHFWPVGPFPSPGIPQAVGKGYLCVDLFFVLSAYVLALNYGPLFAQSPFSPRAFAGFFVRRVARIYPAYIVLFLFQLGFVLLAYGTVSEGHYWGAATALTAPAWDIPTNVLLAQAVGLSPSLLGQAWSMSAEFATYCAFPLLARVAIFGNRHSAWLALVAACLLLIAVIVGNARDGAWHSGALDAYDSTQLTPLMRCVGDFILGLLAFRASQCERIVRLIRHDAVGAVLLVALSVMFATGAPDLAIVAFFPVLVAFLASSSGMAVQLFETAPMMRLGELSYTIYLVHPLLQAPMKAMRDELEHLVPSRPAGVMSGVVTVAVLLWIALTIYRWVEQPGRKMVRHLGAARLGGEG